MRKSKLPEAEGNKLRTSEAKLSPTSNWQEKCGSSSLSVKRKTKKKSPRKKSAEKVEEDSPRECARDQRAEEVAPDAKTLEHKYIQCNVGRSNDEAETALPEEIKPLMINLTFLLHELKDREEIGNMMSKIVTLLTELSRRPIRKCEDEIRLRTPFDEIADQMHNALKEHSGPEAEQYENLVKEVKQLEEELTEKDSEVNYVKEQILEERARLFSSSATLDDRLRNSLLKNHSLKAEIKYNKAQFGKYAKLIAQKEELRQKSLTEMNNLKRKLSKAQQNVESASKVPFHKVNQTGSDMFHGGSVTKYMKSRIKTEKKLKPGITEKRAEMNKIQIKSKPSF